MIRHAHTYKGVYICEGTLTIHSPHVRVKKKEIN